FDPDDFLARVNADLIGKYVNIASRASGFAARLFDGRVLPADQIEDDAQRERVVRLAAQVADAYEEREFGAVARLVMGYADEVNQYFDANKPWEMAKDPAQRDALHRVCSRCLVAFHRITVLLAPMLPATAARVAELFGTPALRWEDLGVDGTVSPVRSIGRYRHLMTRAEAKQLDALFEPTWKLRSRRRDGRCGGQRHTCGSECSRRCSSGRSGGRCRIVDDLDRRVRARGPAHRAHRRRAGGGRVEEAAAARGRPRR